MADLTIQHTFDLAVQHHRAGRVREAEHFYRQILAQQPEHAASIHYLGVVAHQAGWNDKALELIRRAIALQPNYAEAHCNLGNVLRDSGQLDAAIAAHHTAIALRPGYAEAQYNLANALKDKGLLDEAISACRQAIALNPNLPEAHNNLSNALKEKGQLDEAVIACKAALALRPDYAEAYSNLGNILADMGQLDAAIATCHRAISLKPNYAQAYNNLGGALQVKGRLDEAIAAYRQAIIFAPNFSQAYNNLANALKEAGRPEEAIGAGRQAISLQPNLVEAYVNMGIALQAIGELDEAVTMYRQALDVKPNYAEAHSNLGNILKDMGRLDEAIAAYRRAVALRPNYVESHSNLLLALHYHPQYDARSVAHEHRIWNLAHAEPLRKLANAAEGVAGPNRKEIADRGDSDHCNRERHRRIGYVSADFRRHPVGRFLLPLLQCHDHDQFEVHCYSNGAKPDDVTAQLRACADRWSEIGRLSDEQAANQIRNDGIDILVDLAGHTAGNRLLIFARRPAPVQVSYLGYPDSTGLYAIDYRLTDAFADPPGQADHYASEALYRLPQSNWCFAEPVDPLLVDTVHPTRRDHVTFGSFNNFAKLTESMLHVWARILRTVPDSRLMLKSATFATASVTERVRASFAARGIDASRVILRPAVADLATHLAMYRQVDISLDTFPYNGTMTTCEALWMGVPAITLTGSTHVSRVGMSLLSNIGLAELVASSTDDYVNLAVDLARNQDRLKALRLGLRERMRNSPLMDAPRFTLSIEAAFRQMWRERCLRDCVVKC